MRARQITLERARLFFSYDPDSGALAWKQRPSPWKPTGGRAGYIGNQGYVVVGFERNIYVAHQLIWLLHHGEWPSAQIDHINGDRADNRIANLRLATRAQNQANRGKQKNNTTGFKGVVRSHSSKSFTAGIWKDRKFNYLGSFATAEAASAAYELAASRLHGEFAHGNRPVDGPKEGD